jgi:hypothetical protein
MATSLPRQISDLRTADHVEMANFTWLAAQASARRADSNVQAPSTSLQHFVAFHL